MAAESVPSWLRAMVLVLLVAQNSSLRLVMKHARTTSPDFSATLAVFLCEVVKLSVASVLLCRARGWAVLDAVREVLAPRELLRLVPPAVCYLASDRIHHVSVRRLDVAAFQILSQTKVLTVAFAAVLFRGRTFAPRQWGSLIVLALGIAACQVADAGAVAASAPDGVGALCVLSTSCLGAAAGTYTEAVLQRGSGDGVLWKRSAQMALLGTLVAAGPAARESTAGFAAPVYGVVLLNAAGGILVAACMRYADNVLKTLAASLSIVVSTFAAALVLGAPFPSPNFALGGACVVGAIFVYGTTPPAGAAQVAPAK